MTTHQMFTDPDVLALGVTSTRGTYQAFVHEKRSNTTDVYSDLEFTFYIRRRGASCEGAMA